MAGPSGLAFFCLAQRHAAKVGRRVISELKRIEGQLVDAGLMPV